MCEHLIKTPIKSVSVRGVKIAYAPCGVCDECRHTYQNEWFFRLLAELQSCKSQGYHIGFITLTYKDTALPLVPSSCFPEDEWYPVPCFDKLKTRQFIKELRDDLYNNYGVKGCRYFLASEFGETTSRPHYHMIWCWPENTLSSKEMHSLILKHWSGVDEINSSNVKELPNYGICLPMTFNGADYDETRNPFEVTGDVAKPARYAAKYVCKDLAQVKYNNAHQVNEKCSDYKNCKCFHLQSRSFGFDAIKNLSDQDKIKAVTKGMSFVGQDKLLAIPLYFKRKILFDNYYVKKNGKRLVRREPTIFFRQHREEIFNMKKAFFTKLFSEACSSAFWLDRNFDERKSKEYSEILNKVAGDHIDVIASDYVAYYGVDSRCCLPIRACDAWFMRYERYWILKKKDIPRTKFYKNVNSLEKITTDYCKSGSKLVTYGVELKPMYDFVSFFYSALNFYCKGVSQLKREEQLKQQIDALREYYYGISSDTKNGFSSVF